MKKLKKAYKSILAYIYHRTKLKYSLILLLLVLPVAPILSKKIINNTNNTNTNNTNNSLEEKVDDAKDKSDDSGKNIAKGTINTEATTKDVTPSTYKVSNGFTNKSNSTSSSDGNASSSNVNSSISNNSNQVNKVDKSSLVGKDAVISEGDTFEPIKDLKLKAIDKNGSDISNKIEIIHNSVNTTKPGSYSVTANVKLNDGYLKQRSFKVDVKATDLNVAVKSFKPVKEVVQKGDSVVLDLDLSISKKHVTPNSVMINGKEYTLYKSIENIFDRIMNTNRYKVSLTASTLPGMQEYNMSYIKMSDNTLVSTDDTAVVDVLKSEPKVKNFVYEKKSAFKRLIVQFDIEDVDNTVSDLRIELYKDNELLKTEKINSLENYYRYFNTDTNGKYEVKIVGDVNLYANTESRTLTDKVIFKESINISDIDESSLTGKNIEVVQGSSFDPIKDLYIKATDVDGKDITNKVLIENDVNTDLVGNYNVLASITNKNGRKIEKKFEVVVNPTENLDSDNNTNSNVMSRIFGLNSNDYENNSSKSRSLQTKSTLTGPDTKTLTQNVKVTGTVNKKDGSAPDGKIEVELPTTMSFSVDQKGNFSAGDFKVTNHSSTDIQVSVSGFMDLTPNSGIAVKPIGEDMSRLDRSNLNLALLGNTGYVDLGSRIDSEKVILEVSPSGSGFISLLGQSGKTTSENVDANGAKDQFNLIFNIKKKN